MKRMLKIMLIGITAVFILLSQDTSGAAADNTSGDFSYRISRTYVTITQYNGTDLKVTVPSKIKGKVVSKIGKEAFFGANITMITLPKDLSEIGEAAFYECSDLETVIIPGRVKKIGANAFYGCTELKNILLPDSLKEIGSSIFYDCKSLSEISIPYGIKVIPECAFKGCNQLRSIHLPESVKTIECSAFCICINLTELCLPSEITEIKSETFRACTNLPEIELPKGITKIGNQAFESCSKLNKVVIPDMVTELGKGSFAQCTNLSEVIIPNSVTIIGDKAFEECTSLEEITLPVNLTEINAYTFKGCIGLTGIIIPEGIKTLRSGAFYGCTGLDSITLPNSLEEFIIIDEELFYDMYEPEFLDNQPFGGCPALSEIKVGENNKYFKDREGILYSKDGRILYFCPPLWKGDNNVFDKVTYISPMAFANQVYIENLDIPNTVTYIGPGAFYNTAALKKLLLSNHIQTIEECTFSGSGITSLAVPEGVEEIKADAFLNCKDMKFISLPASLKDIDYTDVYDDVGRFDGCISLEKIDVAEGNKDYIDKNGILYEYKSRKNTEMELICYPSSKTGNTYKLPAKTTIAPHAFYQCRNLKKVIIPEGFTTYYSYFSKCKNILVYLPRSMDSFPSDEHTVDFPLFENCKNCYAMVYKDSKAYKYCKKNKVLYKVRGID